MEQIFLIERKRLPGPVGTSCLTCKRRRKKCDQGRPACQRCTAGGYDCLGYDHIQQRKTVKPDLGIDQHGSTENVTKPTTYIDKDNPSDHRLPIDIFSHPRALLPYGYPEAPFYEHIGYNTLLVDISSSFPSTNHHLSPAAINNHPVGVLPLPSSRSKPEENYLDPFHVSNQHNHSSLMATRTAQTLSILSPDTRQLIHYVLDQYERVLDSVYFKPKQRQILKMREMVVSRLRASSIIRCAATLVAKMVESMFNGESRNNRVTFKQSVERFESQLHKVKAQHPNLVESQYLLNEFLEAAFLKMRVSNGYHAYQLFRNAAPTFLEIVYSDPSLWPNPNGPPIACMSKVAASTRFELGHFALMDIICAMAYGLPQVVEYETATLSPEEVCPIEWTHCFPLEFQICIAEMNQRCSRIHIAPDWRTIEYRLLSYKAPITTTDDTESWKTIARLAVLESWRQSLLIYLYMAVCGVSSDDPRVQSAVRQTFQLFKTVKREEPLKIDMHFMVQYLIAGACTRNEKQRAFARKRLLDAPDNEFWLLPGSELVPVLDHLWHGAAANGRAFRWSDYIMSRQAALPIPI